MIENFSNSGELRTHALFQLGMIYQWGEVGNIEIDNEKAQVYYDKALRETGGERMPVYLMSLYNRW